MSSELTTEERLCILNAMTDEQFAAFVTVLEQLEAEVAAQQSA